MTRRKLWEKAAAVEKPSLVAISLIGRSVSESKVFALDMRICSAYLATLLPVLCRKARIRWLPLNPHEAARSAILGGDALFAI